MKKPGIHYLHPYLQQANGHPITVLLIGAGGTGSQVIRMLGQMHHALRGLDRPGLLVRVFDGDTVTPFNVGRQNFAQADIGLNKAEVLVYRANAMYDTRWEAVPRNFDTDELARWMWAKRDERELHPYRTANIIITCVDQARFRVELHYRLYDIGSTRFGDMQQPLYWLDFGNTRDSGQAILGTVQVAEQPKSKEYTACGFLPNVTDLFPNLLEGDEKDEPSCSMQEALQKQGLFINTDVAAKGMDVLFRLLKQGRIAAHGAFINQATGMTVPLPVKPFEMKKTFNLYSCRELPGQISFDTKAEAKERAEDLIRLGFNFNIQVYVKHGEFRWGKCVKVYRKSTYKKLRSYADKEESQVRHRTRVRRPKRELQDAG